MFFIFLFCFFFNGLFGLDPQKSISQYALNSWKTERGLPSNSVYALAQDRSGYIWISTSDGLTLFDGLTFKLFDSVDMPALRNIHASSLLADRNGTIWIGTYRGDLLGYREKKFFNCNFRSPGSSNTIYCLLLDFQGILWLGTAKGLFYLPPDSETFREITELRGRKVRSLLQDRSNRIWVGTDVAGLYYREGQAWKRYIFPKNIIFGRINALCESQSHDLCLGTENGLYFLKDGQWLHYSMGDDGMANNVICLLSDNQGALWMGSESGLYRFYNGDLQSGLAGHIVYSLCQDAEGSLWVGAIDSGLTQIRDEKLTTFSESEGLSGGIFRCLHDDDSGALWIGGAGNYLYRQQADRCEKFVLPLRFKKSSIYSLEQDGDGSFWLGTDLGLLHFQNGRFREIPLPGPNANMETRCVLIDRRGRLWVGTWGMGLLCRQGGTFTAYSTADGLRDDHITSLFEDRRGNLWVGCAKGLNVLSPGNPGKLISERFLDNCSVFSFYEDRSGAMWVGTDNRGLKVYQDGRWGSLNIDQGLFDSRVYAILGDDLGYLWLSSEHGIFRAEKSELLRAAFDPAYKVRGRLFDESDGMKSRICNYGNPSGWKDDSGRLWFANLAGVVSIDPVRMHKNERVPPVLVEEVVVDQKKLLAHDFDRSQEIKLPAGSQKFEFHYTALSFIRSDRIEFKYKLEGYDKEWTSAGNRREAFYTNLKPGRYRFRVRAANADGVWNQAGASFAFFLRPFIYQTWWFLALAALAFAVLSALSWQLLKKYLRAVTFLKKKTQIGHFKILETIGSGGMATVYKAQDLLDKKRIVALKVLKEENFHDENQKKRFKHESLITSQLDHPHIVRIIERGEMEDCWYIAMELLGGESLALLIRRSGRLPVPAALDIMLQIVDALRAIHALNIVHRDLKPENIMVSAGHGRRHFVKLLDFGLAITTAQSRLTMSGVVMGTIRYLPPERISDGTSSPAGDIYSAGIILYEMLTGSKPFWSEATGEVIHRILKTYPLPPKEISPEVPRELNELIMAMIDKEPDRRPNLDAITDELRRLAEKFPPQV